MKLVKPRPGLPGVEGVYASLITPRRDGEIEMDLGSMLDLLDFVSSRGAAGVVLFASTGEFLHFTSEERSRFVGLAARRSRVPVLVNVSHSTLEGVAALAEAAAGAGAAGVLAMPPYFYRYDAGTLRAFFLELAARAGKWTPIYIDNDPASGNALPADLLIELLSTGAFAGIQESNWTLLEQFLPLPVKVLCGDASLHARARHAGAAGGVSGIATAVPELMAALDRAAIAGDDPAITRLEAHLHALLSWVRRFPEPVAIRHACSLRGVTTGGFAVPLGAEKVKLLREFSAWFVDWVKTVESVVRT